MSLDLRSVLRSIDDQLEVDNIDEATTRAINSVQEFDREREYSNSITILEKLISINIEYKNRTQAAKYLDHLISRLLLMKEFEQISKYKSKYDLPKTPWSTLMESIYTRTDDSKKELVLENIEKQSIFGDFKPVPIIPYLEFEEQDEAIDLIEDFYKDGRFIVNLKNKSTSLHQTINIDLGHVEEVNIIEREHIYKIN